MRRKRAVPRWVTIDFNCSWVRLFHLRENCLLFAFRRREFYFLRFFFPQLWTLLPVPLPAISYKSEQYSAILLFRNNNLRC